MPGLPANYRFSSFVLKGEQPKAKPKYEQYTEAYGVQNWDANAVLKVKRDYALGNTTFTQEAAYGNLMERTKMAAKSFNYSRADKLKPYEGVILDLHDESDTVQKLDKMYDIRDGYKV
jgi:hypothetical protein